MLTRGSDKVHGETTSGGDRASARPLSRREIVTLIQEVERMQGRFARRNNTHWVHACNAVLGNCRKLLQDGEG